MVAREKEKAIDAKQQQLQDAYDYEEKEKVYKDKIAELESRINATKAEVNELKSQLGVVGSKLRETEDKFKSDFGVQMKFNTANENALRRMEEKYKRCFATMDYIQAGIHKQVKIAKRNSERDQMALVDFPYAFLCKDFDALTERIRVLLDVERVNEQLIQERNYILAHLGHHSSDDKTTLLNAYRDFAVRTDEDMTTLKQKLEQHLNTIEGQQAKIQNLNKEMETQSDQQKKNKAGTVWQNALLNVMRKQLQDAKKESRVKDSHIKHFESEISKLKAKIAELEATSSRRKQSHSESPDLKLRHNVGDTITDSTPSERRRNSLLPPLNNQIYTMNGVTSPSPKLFAQPKPHQPSIPSRGKWERPNVSVPEGLYAHQVQLGNRGMEYHAAKVNNMAPQRLHGDGKVAGTAGKHNKYAHVRT